MGLWDSVNSVGFFYDRIFPYVSHTNLVKHIRHAISIDEKRGKFKQYPFFPRIAKIGRCMQDDGFGKTPCHEKHNGESKSLNSEHSEQSKKSMRSVVSTMSMSFPSWADADEPPPPQDQLWEEILDAPALNEPTEREAYGFFTQPPLVICEDVEELWFPGDHSDVGGGWGPNRDGQNISNVPLRWMIVEAYKAGCLFKDGALSEFNASYPLVNSLRAPLHDKLDLSWIFHRDNGRDNGSRLQSIFWWILELIPLFTYRLDAATDRWSKSMTPNYGRKRVIPLDVRFHWSTVWRIKNMDYNPSNIKHEHKLDQVDVSKPVDCYDELKIILDGNPML